MRVSRLFTTLLLAAAATAAVAAPPVEVDPAEPPVKVIPSEPPPPEPVSPLVADDDLTLPEKIQLTPEPDAAPTVNIRQLDNGDIVEEYRLNGRLYEVRVTPPIGPTWSVYDTDGDGLLEDDDSMGEISPVYYTIYEWN